MIDNTAMASVKTTISLPKPLYDRIERYRRKAKISRSEVVAMGLRELVTRWDQDQITARINKVLAAHPEINEEQSRLAEAGVQTAGKTWLKNNPW